MSGDFGVKRSYSLQEQVIEFHKAFDHPIVETPTIPSDNRVRFRARFILEEALEFVEACFEPSSAGGLGICSGRPIAAGAQLAVAREMLTRLIENAKVTVDLPKAADALADIDYVVEGSRLEMGLEGGGIAREVHRSNMAKTVLCAKCNGLGTKTPVPSMFNGPCPACDGKGRVLLKREDGKTLKPKNWTPPDIAGELDKQRAKPFEYGLAGILADLQDGGVE
jgi:predicted HAD superfamily Cof-like phosphohydrolase